MTPKVFISHGSEDKVFAQDLATKLRDKGVDAWLDIWEILPGDSLIDKIFEEGLKDATAIIVILSKSSVDKPWVREELNAATVKRITGVSKLIPVILDNCDVPEALHSTVWVPINGMSVYDAELELVVRAIFDFRNKPAIGASPAYTRTGVDVIPGLTKPDSLVFKFSGEEAMRKGAGMVYEARLFEKTRTHDLSDQLAFESLKMLESRNYITIKLVHNTSRLFHSLRMTLAGLEEYARAYVVGYESMPKAVAHQIVNLRQVDSKEIAAALNQPILVINHVIRSFENQNLFKVNASHTGDYNLHVYQISPLLKRVLD